MTHLSGLQPPLRRKFLTVRNGGGPRAVHPALTFAPLALAGLLLAGSLAQTGLALLRDTANRSVVEAGWLEPAQRDLTESRIRLKKLDEASDAHPAAPVQDNAH
jgi:hypothetical protein